MARAFKKPCLAVTALVLTALPGIATASDKMECSVTVRKSSEAACTRIIKSHANSRADRFMAYYNRAWYHQRSGSPEKALEDFDFAERLNRDFSKLYFSRALLKLELNDLDGALEDLDVYAVLEPRDWNGFFQRAQVLRQHGRPKSALSPLNEAARLKPYERDLKSLRVLILSDLGRDSEAAIEADRLVAGRRSDPVSRYARAVVSFRQGSLDNALSDIKAGLRRQALFPAAHALRGQILEMRDDVEAAKSAYRRALKSAGPTIDRETSQDLARRRLDVLNTASTARVALQTQHDSPFGRAKIHNNKNAAKNGDCRRYIPSAAATVSVPCGN